MEYGLGIALWELRGFVRQIKALFDAKIAVSLGQVSFPHQVKASCHAKNAALDERFAIHDRCGVGVLPSSSSFLFFRYSISMQV